MGLGSGVIADGEMDESCVDSSPARGSKGRVVNLMTEANKSMDKQNKFRSMPNASNKLKGIRGVNNVMTNMNLIPPVHRSQNSATFDLDEAHKVS